MIIFFGTRRYGAVDHLETGARVETMFFHMWFVPLVPTKSYLVVADGGRSFRGVELPMSGKSVLAAYLRTACVFGAIGAIIGFLASLGSISRGGMEAIAWTVVAAVVAAGCIA